MQKAPIVIQRPLFRALPTLDLFFLFGLGIVGLAACLAVGLR